MGQKQSKGEFLYQQVNYGNVESIKSLRSKLTQQLEILKRKTASSVSKQEQQLNVILEDTQSFLATKRRATDDLKVQLQKLKDKYNSDIQNLAVPAQDLHENSQLAFSKVNSKISKHSSAFMDVSGNTSFSQRYFLSTLSSLNFPCILMQLVGKISADVNAILNDLQGNIRELEYQTRRYHEIQITSEVLLNFFKTLNTYISKLRLMDEKSQTINNQQLWSKCSIEGIKKMQISYKSRSKNSWSAGSKFSNIKTRNINAEFSDIQGCANSAYEKWTTTLKAQKPTISRIQLDWNFGRVA
ncbi:hypothetical protein H5410_044934 [Solanum commersonii]|uniref:Uncharacterized protein n=1 Tax=Solanum commersonii TaxID=4109 RepID=A0A9J5XBB7_SOLCO|nr:hypothetical protein H5410_044934 [Solanum commersonii]